MDTANSLWAQAQWELEGTRRAVAQYRAAAAVADPSTLPSGQWLLRQVIPPLIEKIKERQVDGMRAIGNRKVALWSWAIQVLSPEALAFITAHRGFSFTTNRAGEEMTITQLAMSIVGEVEIEAEFHNWIRAQETANAEAKEQGKWSHRNYLLELKRMYPNLQTRTWKKWAKRVKADKLDWEPRVRLALGTALIEALCEAAPQHFTIQDKHQAADDLVKSLQLSEDTRRRLQDLETRAELARPLKMPMLIPPRDWTYDCTGIDIKPQKNLTGGYTLIKLDPITRKSWTHTTDVPGSVSQTDLDAWNTLQRVPWRVNTWVLDVMQSAWTDGLRLGGLEVMEPLPLPPRVSDDAWTAMETDTKRDAITTRRAIHAENATRYGRGQAVLDSLSVSTELRDVERFYYPYVKDFRHRLYAATNRGPQPQGNDISKALIMFADGKPLGPDGVWWLCIRAANCFGLDKQPLEERYKWTIEHQDQIAASVLNPLTYNWWTTAAEPWQFLATCYELREMWSLSEPDMFVSHLPIPLDGTCNGLQHLSAMGLDPIGAVETNLTCLPVKKDIYSVIARKVALQIEQDALDGVEFAKDWVGKVDRKTVKRAVMTTPYGVTSRGIRDQLINDRLIPSGEDTIGGKADYMTFRIQEALGETVKSAQAIMEWLRSTARHLAKAGLPFEWTTPSGSRVRQAYTKLAIERIQTLVGSLTLKVEVHDGELSANKQAAGSAPNVVHSFDAAHLALTVNAAREAGVTHFAMIHDSYGTHAADTTKLGVALRRCFVSVYARDWLTAISEGVRAYAPLVLLDKLPPRGSFDINEVNEAEYFFS